ncbi:MobA/MobL family protein [Acidithiobacillus sp. VAN18-1]|uniref:MobA/MobL family protein n=1 Tax=Igneacidithiobacillus copahuensis TaxID=2724909 RepID=A0AAE2YQ27_9PROT|nr:MobA/MobL family protein [Igneacidithiobacillus copahuensis]MBU2788064.1 MobA/MobL family protein [Igneacidithiobacillus copahuensis]MBU2795374.1 MobA/MobL family protein [Acidithiobacillus sp. VAN18-2]
MAIYHLHVSSGSKTSGKGAGGKARYLLRDGPYAIERERVHDGATVRTVEIDKSAECIHAESGNMPSWAADNPLAFWDASDSYERANGSTYRELEAALPAELSLEQQIALAQDFAREVSMVGGGVTPYTLVLHQQDSAHPERRHVHLLLSDRIQDGQGRPPETFFKRYNAKAPERGGARKTPERQDTKVGEKWTDRLRPLWENLANDALKRAGKDARIDHRRLSAQRQELEQRAAQVRYPEQAEQLRQRAELLDRPAQPKKGRVLTHAGPEKAPDRAAKVHQYEQAKAERQAAIEARREAEREALEASRKLEVLERAQERHRGRDILDRVKTRERWNQRKRGRQNRQWDAEAAAEGRPGIRHPDRPQWQQYRERMLTEAYDREVAQALGRWVQVERTPEGLRLHNRHLDVTDFGDRIVAGMGGQEREIEAMLKLARAKGWRRLELTGPEEFRQRAGAAALAAGFDLADADLKAGILEQQRIEQAQRQAEAEKRAEREKAIAEIMATIDIQKADSFDRRIAALQDAAIPVSDESLRLARQDALRKWEGKQDKDWLRAAKGAGGWNALRKQYQAEYDRASTGLLSWTPARRHEAARLDGQLKQLDSLLAERKRSADAAELALDEKHETAAQFWARVSPHLDAARERFQERHQVWKENEEVRERGERRRKLLDFAKALRADSDARMDIGPAYRAAGYQLQEQKDGKKAWVYPHDDLRDERLEIKQARKEWDTRKRERLERERQAAEALAERERREAEAASAAFLEPRAGQGADRQPDWISGAPRKAPSRWQQWREQTLSERYGDDLAGRAAKEDWYIRMRPDLGGLNIQVRTHTGKMEVVDSGRAIRAEQGEADIPLMLDIARAYGWTTLDITGAEEFRQAAAAAALQRRFSLTDKALEKAARQRIEQERKKRQAELAKQQRRRQPPQRGPDIGDEW